MFILPPPPKYYTAPGHGVPALEATNTHTVLDDKANIQAPEGVYEALDCVFLATPLPHPSDPPAVVVNPLAPTINRPGFHSSGVRASTLVLSQRAAPGTLPQLARQSSEASYNNKSTGGASGKSFGGVGSWTSSLFSQGSSAGRTRASTASTGGENAIADGDETASVDSESALSGLLRRDSAFSNASTAGGTGGSAKGDDKKRRPKNSLTKNNSSFISRTVIHEHMQKRLAERQITDIFVWANVGRSISWLDFNLAQGKDQANRHEPLTKILFTKAHPLAHDVNAYTKSPQNIDLIIGTSAGDAIWVEAISSRYNRINKNGDVTRSAITACKWIPGSEGLFITGHADGSLAIFDKEREDAGFANAGAGDKQDPRSSDTFTVIRSYYNPANNPRHNPVAVYKASNAPISGLRFSPNSEILAVTSSDGYLRLLDLATEQVTDIFPSYYGGFLSVAFSPDSRYLIAGGQDDTASIYCLTTKTVIARCQGHRSWVRAVAFDPYNSDSSNYRIGTVGEDGRLLLWDFAPKTLARPRAAGGVAGKHHPHQSHHRTHISKARSIGSIHSFNDAPDNASSASTGRGGSDRRQTALHEFVGIKDVPFILPVAEKSIHVSEAQPEPLSDLAFLETHIIAVGKDGRIWTWRRPRNERLTASAAHVVAS